ncbi:Osmoregulated proline transporter OpuE [BD1-7 clade bacterium]|uniref:Sodium/proline symporter n=1 Tax=BD1-7 clade bacterium TaxID=2029982 RepID=A0A5S9PNW1_9GAMM|nr:Osmoregulated proline transporter OpuE [BD1-7 clade bacterium]
MPEFVSAVWITFFFYLLVMVAIGYVAYQRNTDAGDYFLGGRQLGPWPAALSAGASDMSGWLLLGLPGYAYASGVESFWLALGLFLGTWANWRFMAARLRVFTESIHDAITIPEYLRYRFNDTSGGLQVLSACFILLFFLFYTSSGLVAGGKLFETVFGLDYPIAVVVGTLCIVSYTFFGGFLAVSWTDLVQGLLMAVALMIVPLTVMTMHNVPVFHEVRQINPSLMNMFTDNTGKPLGIMAIVSLLAWGLGYFGQPHILARFAAIRSVNDIGFARRIAVSWTGISMLGALAVGFTGLVFTHHFLSGSLEDAETIFMVLVNQLFHPVVAGVLLAAILAAIMSTADSQLLVSSSALAEDLYKPLIRPDASEKEVMRIGQLGVVVIALLAMWLALDEGSSVLSLVAYAWAGFGAAFGPVLLASVYWRGMSRAGAFSGILMGGVTVVVWKSLDGGVFDLYEILPGVAMAVFGIIAGSKLKPDNSAEIFDMARAQLPKN